MNSNSSSLLISIYNRSRVFLFFLSFLLLRSCISVKYKSCFIYFFLYSFDLVVFSFFIMARIWDLDIFSSLLHTAMDRNGARGERDKEKISWWIRSTVHGFINNSIKKRRGIFGMGKLKWKNRNGQTLPPPSFISHPKELSCPPMRTMPYSIKHLSKPI